MGKKKECSCGYWNKEQEECLYNGSGCAKDKQQKPQVTEELIEEKAKILDDFFGAWWDRFGDFDTTPEKERDAEFKEACKDFIRSLFEED